MTPALTFTELLRTTLPLACWESRLLDVEPSTATLEPSCTAWLTKAGSWNDLPACPAGPTTFPCYRIVEEPQCAHAGSGYDLRIEGTRILPDQPMQATVECVIDATDE